MKNKNRNTNEPIIWTGNLNHDCTAIWAGLMLRAERTDRKSWWWGVSDLLNDGFEVDDSHNYRKRFVNGKISRKEAERAAKEYLKVKNE